MNILDHNEIVIFSFPRAGTKLLARIVQDIGYHRYGEWFDTWSSSIDGDVARRKSKEDILKAHQNSKERPAYQSYIRTLETISRFDNLPPKEKFVITLWPDNLDSMPFVLERFKDSYWLLPKRNHWDQLISWFVSMNNQNYEGQHQSKPISIDTGAFIYFYWKLQQVESLQNWISKNKKSSVVEFDKLVSGSYAVLGGSYNISTVDEHSDIEKLVTNIESIRQTFRYLELEKIKLFPTVV